MKINFELPSFFDLPPVTKTLIFVIGTVYLLGLFFAPMEEWFFDNLALYPLYQNTVWADNFQLWQPFTSQFIHSSFIKVSMCVFLLWTFGTAVEKTLGSTFYAIFFFVCSLGSAFTYLFITPYPFDIVYGSGGFCMATFIAYAWLNPNRRVFFVFPPMHLSAKGVAVAIFIITILLGLLANNEIAASPTLGEMVTGLICMYVWRLWFRNHSSFDDYDYEEDDYERYMIK